MSSTHHRQNPGVSTSTGHYIHIHTKDSRVQICYSCIAHIADEVLQIYLFTALNASWNK